MISDIKPYPSAEIFNNKHASNISLIESIVIIFYLLSLIVTGGSITTACLVVVVTLDLFKEIVFFIRSEIILSSGLSAKRFAVSKLLEIIKTASNSLVAVAVKSVEIDGSSAVDTGIYFGSLKDRLTVCINDARCGSTIGIDEICICISRIVRSL